MGSQVVIYLIIDGRRDMQSLLAQHDALTARHLAARLELSSVDVLPPWLKRLLDWQLARSSGRTQATRYFVDPGLLRGLEFAAPTTLKHIESHRLAALALEDRQRYPRSAVSGIWTVSMTSRRRMCCSRRLMSIWRRPWRRSGTWPPDCKDSRVKTTFRSLRTPIVPLDSLRFVSI